jgi:hypothetical protein
MLHIRIAAATAILATLASAGAAADSMRCGKWIVSEAATVDELLQKCGQPQTRDISKEDSYATNPSGARYKTGVVVVTERWIYKPSPGTLPMAVSVVDGKVVSLTRAD